MATLTVPEGRALLPMKYVVGLFKKQTLEQLEINMMTQRIWPYEVYPGYAERNERRRREGGWYSTGEGIKSFEGYIIEADEETGMITMSFRYNAYMEYVDIGVGAGRKVGDVDRARKVRFKQRYTQWNPSEGRSHRPGLRPELNHLATRLADYMQDFYGKRLEFKVLETFQDLTIFV